MSIPLFSMFLSQRSNDSVARLIHSLKSKAHNNLPFRGQYNGRNMTCKGVVFMAKRRGIMSEQFKVELAKELGIYDTVQREGWGGIRSRDAGNMVKRAIEIAQEQLAGNARN
jgi:small acid-soluble spore protein F (minor alpha/beta-type SASP)